MHKKALLVWYNSLIRFVITPEIIFKNEYVLIYEQQQKKNENFWEYMVWWALSNLAFLFRWFLFI